MFHPFPVLRTARKLDIVNFGFHLTEHHMRFHRSQLVGRVNPVTIGIGIIQFSGARVDLSGCENSRRGGAEQTAGVAPVFTPLTFGRDGERTKAGFHTQ